MNHLQATKIVSICPPTAILDNAAFTTTAVDTLGFGKARIYAQFGAMDIAMAALKLQQSDSSSTGFTDVTGADFSVSPANLPSATSDNTFFIIDVDLRGKKRYLDLYATAGDGSAGTYMSAFAILSDAADAPYTATQVGADQILKV